MIDDAKLVFEKAEVNKVALQLPTDVVVADRYAPDANYKVCFLITTLLDYGVMSNRLGVRFLLTLLMVVSC